MEKTESNPYQCLICNYNPTGVVSQQKQKYNIHLASVKHKKLVANLNINLTTDKVNETTYLVEEINTLKNQVAGLLEGYNGLLEMIELQNNKSHKPEPIAKTKATNKTPVNIVPKQRSEPPVVKVIPVELKGSWKQTLLEAYIGDCLDCHSVPEYHDTLRNIYKLNDELRPLCEQLIKYSQDDFDNNPVKLQKDGLSNPDAILELLLVTGHKSMISQFKNAYQDVLDERKP